jgi:8-oxo-dGTP diphosphatase
MGVFVCYTVPMSEQHVRVGIGVFIFKDGKFLMMKRQGSHGAGTWSLPGGHLEFNESFEDTARREVMEETGLTVKNVRFGAVTNDIFTDEGKHYITVWVLSDYAEGKEQILEPDKCTGMQWRTFDDLPQPLFYCWNQLLASEFIDAIKHQAKKK